MMIEVKICGVCNAEDARAASAAGASWIGVILAPGRTRTRTLAEARAIYDACSARRVGVFVDAPALDVIDAAQELALDAVQLHGDETTDMIRQIRQSFAGEVWKALRVRDAEDVTRGWAAYRTVTDALLLDGWSASGHGGAGARFDWNAIARSGAIPPDARIVVAGGLTPENAAAAVALLRPALVDVSSGVESSPGCKSSDRMRAFIEAVRSLREVP